MNRESGVDIYSLPCVKRRAGAKLLQNRNGSAQLCGASGWYGVGGGGREAREGGDTFLHRAGSPSHIAETNTTL